MDKRFRHIFRNVATGRILTVVFTIRDIEKDRVKQSLNSCNECKFISMDQDTGLKDMDGNSIFENDLLFSDQFIKPVVVTYCDGLGLWTDNTYTEELYKNIHKFKLKVIGNKFENEDLLNKEGNLYVD